MLPSCHVFFTFFRDLSTLFYLFQAPSLPGWFVPMGLGQPPGGPQSIIKKKKPIMGGQEATSPLFHEAPPQKKTFHNANPKRQAPLVGCPAVVEVHPRSCIITSGACQRFRSFCWEPTAPSADHANPVHMHPLTQSMPALLGLLPL